LNDIKDSGYSFLYLVVRNLIYVPSITPVCYPLPSLINPIPFFSFCYSPLNFLMKSGVCFISNLTHFIFPSCGFFYAGHLNNIYSIFYQFCFFCKLSPAKASIGIFSGILHGIFLMFILQFYIL